MPEFKRYRNADGAEFSLAISPELAAKRSLTDVTSDDNPAVDASGKPLRDKPADRRQASATKVAPAKPTPSTAPARSNDAKEA